MKCLFKFKTKAHILFYLLIMTNFSHLDQTILRQRSVYFFIIRGFFKKWIGVFFLHDQVKMESGPRWRNCCESIKGKIRSLFFSSKQCVHLVKLMVFFLDDFQCIQMGGKINFNLPKKKYSQVNACIIPNTHNGISKISLKFGLVNALTAIHILHTLENGWKNQKQCYSSFGNCLHWHFRHLITIGAFYLEKIALRALTVANLTSHKYRGLDWMIQTKIPRYKHT